MQLCIPVFLTYEDYDSAHTVVSTAYQDGFCSGSQRTPCGHSLPEQVQFRIHIHLFLMPLQEKALLQREFDRGLKIWQKLVTLGG